MICLRFVFAQRIKERAGGPFRAPRAHPVPKDNEGARRAMLTVGDKFPAFHLKAAVSLEKGKEFKDITEKDYAGKWKVVFFWPMDFTFICPTEIAEFGKQNRDFLDRDAQILGVSSDTHSVHRARRPAQGRRRAPPRDVHRRPHRDHPLRRRERSLGWTERGGSAARAR